jgi:hypothetical protein
MRLEPGGIKIGINWFPRQKRGQSLAPGYEGEVDRFQAG